jgi:hypothetical protein
LRQLTYVVNYFEQAKYGWYAAFAMETSLLYNTEILVNLFAILGIVRYLRLNIGDETKMASSLISITFPPILCTILYYCFSIGVKRKHTIAILSLFILAFVADSIFIITKFVLYRYLQGYWKSPNASVFSAGKPVFMFTILLWIALYFTLGHNSWFRIEFAAVATTIAWVVLLSILMIATIPKIRGIQQTQAFYFDRQLNYVVLLLWVLPPIIIGELYAIIKGIHTWCVYVILVPVLVRLVLTTYTVLFVESFLLAATIPMGKQIKAMRRCRFIVLSLCCWRLLTFDVHDQVVLHPLPTLILVATAFDTLESLIM